MPPKVTAAGPARPSAAAWNNAIRAHCAGRLVWSTAALAELARLRAEWQAAVERETVVPAA